MAPVETQEQFERWLEEQPHEVCVAIATRAALRVFPFVAHSDSHDTVQKNLALLAVRCLLTSGIAANVPSATARFAARSANAAASRDPADVTQQILLPMSPGRVAAYTAARIAAVTAFDHEAVAAVNASGAAKCAADALVAFEGAVHYTSYADTELNSLELMAAPLWDSPNEPDWLRDKLKSTPNILDGSPAWAFWRRWYQGFLEGEPLDWELQRRVALIDTAIWAAGPEAVAAEIERIEAKFHLEQEIKRLKEQLAQVDIAPTVDRKHNNPPPLDDETTAQSKVISLIWTDLEDLEAEISDEEPDPDKIKQVAQRLWLLAVRIATYCGNKIDTTLDAAAKEIGTTGSKWVIRTGVAYLAATQEGTQSVAKLAWQYAERLLSGG